jgi:hypothetical protein
MLPSRQTTPKVDRDAIPLWNEPVMAAPRSSGLRAFSFAADGLAGLFAGLGTQPASDHVVLHGHVVTGAVFGKNPVAIENSAAIMGEALSDP